MFLWATARLTSPSATFSSAMVCGLKDWPPNVMFLNLDNETRKMKLWHHKTEIGFIFLLGLCTLLMYTIPLDLQWDRFLSREKYIYHRNILYSSFILTGCTTNSCEIELNVMLCYSLHSVLLFFKAHHKIIIKKTPFEHSAPLTRHVML